MTRTIITINASARDALERFEHARAYEARLVPAILADDAEWERYEAAKRVTDGCARELALFVALAMRKAIEEQNEAREAVAQLVRQGGRHV